MIVEPPSSHFFTEQAIIEGSCLRIWKQWYKGKGSLVTWRLETTMKLHSFHDLLKPGNSKKNISKFPPHDKHFFVLTCGGRDGGD